MLQWPHTEKKERDWNESNKTVVHFRLCVELDATKLGNCIENHCLWKNQINPLAYDVWPDFPVLLFFPLLFGALNADLSLSLALPLSYVHFIVIVTTVDFVNNVATLMSTEFIHKYKYSKGYFQFFGTVPSFFLSFLILISIFEAIFHVFKHVSRLPGSPLTTFFNVNRHAFDSGISTLFLNLKLEVCIRESCIFRSFDFRPSSVKYEQLLPSSISSKQSATLNNSEFGKRSDFHQNIIHITSCYIFCQCARDDVERKLYFKFNFYCLEFHTHTHTNTY